MISATLMIALSLPVPGQTFEITVAEPPRPMIDIKEILEIAKQQEKTDPFDIKNKTKEMCPGCKCGCAETGECVCDKPKAKPKKRKIAGYENSCKGGGGGGAGMGRRGYYSYASAPVATTYYSAPMIYSSGACTNGSCGVSGSCAVATPMVSYSSGPMMSNGGGACGAGGCSAGGGRIFGRIFRRNR